MCIFPEARLITPRSLRLLAAKQALNKNLGKTLIANDIVRLLGLTRENQHEKSAVFSNSLWRMPYQEQLEYKAGRASSQMRRLSEIVQETVIRPVVDEKTGFFPWLDMRPIIPSPKITEYRSKEGYMVNMGVDGDPRTVGVPYGASRLLVSIPASATNSMTAKPAHRVVSRLFQDYLHHPDTPAMVVSTPHCFAGDGYKYINIRSSRLCDKLMLIVQFKMSKFNARRLEDEKRRLVDYFLDRSFNELPTSRISSIFFQRIARLYWHPSDPIPEHLAGDEFLQEHILGRVFRISASTFFQINVECSEMLFRAVIEQCPLDKNSVLLDLGCGAGVYSIVLADYVERAIGIDLNIQCIDDARINAHLNGVQNATFIHGRLETVSDDVLDPKAGQNLVCICNPGRWGLMADTVKILRRFETLKTLIYVSCYPYETAFANFVNLLNQPNADYPGKPFRLTKAIPVDMFPQTPHYELILLFER